ncbi:MAG: neutral/alkaline non-lysosomal ceramidase N-terminal domain-containing protein [Planctomycetaceae bacterium]|jgi:hypothetical protein
MKTFSCICIDEVPVNPLALRYVFCAALTVVFASATEATELRAGVARKDLTPPLSMNSPLGGYGARMNQPATGVHDRIFAKALVLAGGGRKFVLVTCDLLGLAPPVKPEIVKQLSGDGWTAEQILILPSHSHASIEMNALNPNNVFAIPQIGIHDQMLYEFTVANFVELIRSAAKDLQPVRVGTTSHTISGWNRNRRGDGGGTDDELTITRVDTLHDKPLAVLVNFTAHPTFMTEEQMMFSAGWPGALQQTMEAAIGNSVTAMYYNGAQGDQAPQSRPDSGGSPWEKAARYGLDLGLLAASSWQDIPTERDVKFGFHLQPIELPPRSWHPDFMSTGGREYGLTEELLADLLPRMQPDRTVSGSLRLGNLLLVGIPGEMAAALGLEVKEHARRITGATHPVIGGLANEWISYILSADAYRAGHYEASISFYGETLGATIIEGALAGVRELR